MDKNDNLHHQHYQDDFGSDVDLVDDFDENHDDWSGTRSSSSIVVTIFKVQRNN